jgi:PAS domain S-box-containing protein
MANAGILIATNEAETAQDLSERLGKLGYQVVGCVASRQEIVEKIEETSPDLILAEIQLQGKREGIKTGALIRTNFHKPIVYITGSVGQATIQRAGSTGPFGYIFRPFDDKQIYAMIETALLRYNMEGELRDGRRWLHAVLNGINDGVIALNQLGEIRFINPIARKLMGWSEAETWNRRFDEVFILLDERTHEKIDIFNVKRSLGRENTGSTIEGLLQSKDGRATPVEADLTILEEENNPVAGMVLVFRDVSKQREAVQEIRRQSRRAQVLVESASRLNAQLELASVLDTVCNICNLALQASATAVYLEDARQDVFNLRAASTVIKRLEQLERKQFDLPGSLFRSLLSAKQPVAIISDVQSFPNVPYPEFFKEQNLHTLGMAGLYRRDDLIGVLISVFMGDPVQLPEDTQTLLKGLADQAAIAIINSSLFEQVRRGREHQKALTTRLVEIQEIERRHIARELHDQIGQVLTGLQFMLESLKTTSGEAQLVRIGETQETIIGLIEQIREMSLNLRPSMLDDLGLLPTLAWHFERYTKQTGIKVSFNSAGISERLNPEVETTVYRIVQEALTNIARHAQVTEALVRLVVRKNILGIEIIDHGVGFEPSFELSKTSTAGLAGMRERANLLGGDLVIKSVPRQGTKVMAMLPLERKAMERRNRDRDLGGG